jgi:hypothetical protein
MQATLSDFTVGFQNLGHVAALALATRRAFGPGEDGQRAYFAMVREELVRRRVPVEGEIIALSVLDSKERLRALESIQRRKRESDRTRGAVVGGVLLTERLLRAVEAVAHHGEFIACRFVGADGSVTNCQLLGAGDRAGTARVRRWGDGRPAGRAVRLEEIALPALVVARLERVAAEQSSEGGL